MPALSATIRKRAEQATLELPFRVPPQEWFTLRQAGAVLGLAESTVEKLYDNREFCGHSHNAGSGQRMHKRILRASLIAYAIRTADYEDETLADGLLICLRHLPASTLTRIAQATAQLIEAKKFSPAQPVIFPRSASVK